VVADYALLPADVHFLVFNEVAEFVTKTVLGYGMFNDHYQPSGRVFRCDVPTAPQFLLPSFESREVVGEAGFEPAKFNRF
jgi:hypothetical protein